MLCIELYYFIGILIKDTINKKDMTISESLTAEQQADVMRLLEEFQCMFTDMSGTTNMAEHKIELTTNSTLRVRPYPMHYETRGSEGSSGYARS